MSQESQPKVWWYAKNGQKFGPFVAVELKNIAHSGQLLATDLIWKEGLPKWLPASSVKGLLPATTPAAPPPLPPLQQEIAKPIAPISTTRTAQVVAPHEPNSTVAFWNPIALSNWSFLLSPIFGTYLVAENYKVMGKLNEAKKQTEWFYISIAIQLSILLLVPLFGRYGFLLTMAAYFTNFFIWNFRAARK